jgi:hypothetical protein
MQCRVKRAILNIRFYQETVGESNLQHPGKASELSDRNRRVERRRAAR